MSRGPRTAHTAARACPLSKRRTGFTPKSGKRSPQSGDTGYIDINQLVEAVVNRDTAAPARCNRLILFSPWMFHNSAADFGMTPADDRLAYLMFFAAAPQG